MTQDISDGSDASVLNSLFNKAFAQYWMLLWHNDSYVKFEPFGNEIENAIALWGQYMTPVTPETRDSQPVPDPSIYTGRSVHTELERHRKLAVLNKLQDAFQLLILGCDLLDIVSRNDELDDVHTEHLKYLMLPFLAGHVMIEKPDVPNRINILRRCTVYLTEYMHVMSKLKVLRENESTYWEREAEASMTVRRNFKVESASFSLGISRSMKTMFGSSTAVERFFDGLNATPMKDEDGYRSIMMDLMRLLSVEAINMLDMIRTELPMLERRACNSGPSTEASDKASTVRSHGKPWFIQVDDVAKLDLATAHLLYKSMVFIPGHKLPEIYLEECARIEMEMDVGTIGSKGGDARKRGMRITRESDAIGSSGSDADSDADPESTVEQAKWDDWKDDHPRGSGNKNRNVG